MKLNIPSISKGVACETIVAIVVLANYACFLSSILSF